ncbi:bifunctional RIO kinase/Winged helix-like DNA-binding domain superfamily/Winged helix DNA-binding domain superfamily/RIO2 kinase winged helix domain [Babesia duncani]|uniref:Serine/threonine-protein kinase RIO2 n=1 Tax=Babesia duncani TaxID=323732 RepID=A0AAD9UNR4_9APIC|nr:bifunctional RIO kinase/Winged helix-like DNA-binding domain superfamily/Winged helix DNA-binding domain superfamily/RIO2 kinase winged helix domain [Babesia duncani]
MKLDPQHFCYMSKTDFRVLTAIEVGMRNHEFMPLQLIATTANVRSCGLSNILASLLKAKLIVHSGKSYDGYKLTFLGLDFLAIRALNKRGIVNSIGRRIGVGKEADVHLCTDKDGNLVVLKLHRLGRISFRSVKHNRDYLGRRKHASWMYLSQIAAKKEYSYLRNLYDASFPVPEPLDINRHIIVMKFIDAIPLSQVQDMSHPKRVLDKLMDLIVRLAKMGIIHGDFNGFNLMISEDGSRITVIDFPQVIPVTHENAEFYFNRDIECLRNMFLRKFKMQVVDYPRFKDIVNPQDNETQVKAAKFKVDIRLVDDLILNEIFDKMQGCEEACAAMEQLDLTESPSNSTPLSVTSSNVDAFTPLAPESNGNESSMTSESISEASDDSESSDSLSDKGQSQSVNQDTHRGERQIEIWTPDIKRTLVKAYRRKLASKPKPKTKLKSNKHKMQLL